MNDTLWWDVCRAAGLVSWVFLTLATVWGALVSGRFARRPRIQRWLNDLHPYLGTLGLAALGLHVVAAVADSYTLLGWVDTVVPFTAQWRPAAMAAGVVALWALAVVEATSLARRRLRRRTWHRIHLASYGAAWLVALHAAMAGTDLANPWVARGSLGLVAATTWVAARRAGQGRRAGRFASVPGPAAGGAAEPAGPAPARVGGSVGSGSVRS